MSSTKNIAKNSMFLYFRMFLTMGVGLYTSRLVLEALGVVDYGIYGLVGGIVSMFAFLNSAMASATQRYLSFDIGKQDWERLQKTFNATLNIHILIAVIIFILAETVGLWFVNYKLEIPAERMTAANWVYQFSIFAFVTSVVQVPYNALLFAREHMKVYAYVSVLETILKLIIVLILVQAATDKLILYGILTFAVSFVIRMVYKMYCKKHFKESIYQFHWNKAYYKELMSYSGWNLFGSIADMSRRQGSNIILNLFYGPTVNAAYVLSESVYGIVSGFINSVQVAFNPQIVKSFSVGNKKQTLNLVYLCSKFTFFSMLVVITPLIINIRYFVRIWLGDKNIPNHTIEFIRLGLIAALLINMSNPMSIAISATGKIKIFEIINASLKFVQLFLIWLLFKLFPEPIIMYYIFILVSIIILLFKVYYIRNLYKVTVKEYLFDLLRMFFVGMIVIISFFFCRKYIIENSSIAMLLFKSIGVVFYVGILTLLFGISKNEKIILKAIIFKRKKLN